MVGYGAAMCGVVLVLVMCGSGGDVMLVLGWRNEVVGRYMARTTVTFHVVFVTTTKGASQTASVRIKQRSCPGLTLQSKLMDLELIRTM